MQYSALEPRDFRVNAGNLLFYRSCILADVVATRTPARIHEILCGGRKHGRLGAREAQIPGVECLYDLWIVLLANLDRRFLQESGQCVRLLLR